MDKIRNVAVIGAGAMGAFFATRFFDTPGFSTVLVARGRRLERLRCEGLLFNGKHYALEVIDPDEAARPMDLVIVAVNIISSRKRYAASTTSSGIRPSSCPL